MAMYRAAAVPADPGAARLRLLARDSRGVAALEFALIAPFMFFLVLGLASLTQGFRANSLVTSTASSMSNVVASQASVTGSSLQDICAGVQLTMQPFDLTRITVSVASYTVHGGTTSLDWEHDMTSATSPCQPGGTALGASGLAAANNILTPASGPRTEGDSAIVARVNYSFAGAGSPALPTMNPSIKMDASIPALALSQLDAHRVRGLVTSGSGSTVIYTGSVVCTGGC